MALVNLVVVELLYEALSLAEFAKWQSVML
jgi:hypothetical protein